MACFAILALLGLCSTEPAPSTGPAGRVAVIDGDTIDVGGARVRLHGVDAPESTQSCGTGSGAQWACGDWVTQEASLRFAGREAVCETVDIDRYERIVARCVVDGNDIGETLVSEGLALAYVEYSDVYVQSEAAARQAGRGIWRGEVEAPWDWRRAKREGQAASVPAQERVEAGGCAIKGNVSSRGRIYHMPGDPLYRRTKIDTSEGERWFCDESEARRAGWRPAGS